MSKTTFKCPKCKMEHNVWNRTSSVKICCLCEDQLRNKSWHYHPTDKDLQKHKNELKRWGLQ